MEQKKRCTAICLSAGSGKRMGTSIAKQYLDLNGKPIICYALETFEKSSLIDEVILVVGEDSLDFARKEIVEKFGYRKVKQIIIGGTERYLSVRNALQAMRCHEQTKDENCGPNQDGYVFIHDGARPFVSEKILQNVYEGVVKYDAVCVGVPVKDTIRIVDEEGFSKETPDRAHLYAVQTPQAFTIPIIQKAYEKLDALMEMPDTGYPAITDDAMVVEKLLGRKVKMIPGAYENIKITTPEDMEVAKVFLNRIESGI